MERGVYTTVSRRGIDLHPAYHHPPPGYNGPAQCEETRGRERYGNGGSDPTLAQALDSPVDNLTIISELAALLGEYPLMLELAGAYLRDVMLNDGLPLAEAIDSLRAPGSPG